MNKRRTGAGYEEQAARFLEGQGMQVIGRNYRCRQGEIDLIARDGTYLVFVEVKYRKNSKNGHPAEAVDRRKQNRITSAAFYFCYEQKIPENQPCRFDVVCVLGEKTEHIKDAFYYQ